MTTEAERVVDELAGSTATRRRLAALLGPELSDRHANSAWQRARPFMAAFSSAAVVLLAFLVPSMQDQWDRYKIRTAIDRYAQVGRKLMQDERYESAEQAYGRALELAGNQRLDLLEGQLSARVMRVYDSPEWRSPTDETITEADFIYLLELESARERPLERASTIGAYGVYLAGLKRWSDALKNLQESAALDPGSAVPHIHLGNLYDDLGRPADAEAQYRQAIALNPREPNAHYNLGLLLNASGRAALAPEEFALSVKYAPEDTANRIALIETLESQRQLAAALVQAQAAQKVAPDNKEINALVKRLQAGPH